MSSRRAPAKPPVLPPTDEHPRLRALGSDHNTVLLGPRDRVIGQLHLEGDLCVQGTVEGEVLVTGDVEIGDTAQVKASVAGREVRIRGRVSGPVTAGRLLLAGSGSLLGDVRVPRLVVEEGATLNGNVAMSAAGEAAAAAQVGAAPKVERPAAVSRGPKAQLAKSRRRIKRQ